MLAEPPERRTVSDHTVPPASDIVSEALEVVRRRSEVLPSQLVEQADRLRREIVQPSAVTLGLDPLAESFVAAWSLAAQVSARLTETVFADPKAALVLTCMFLASGLEPDAE